MPKPALLALALAILLARALEPSSLAAAALVDAPALAEALAAEREALERDPNAPVLGNPEGDVTVVEFMDYNCATCRTIQPEVRRLLEADPGVRLVIREWPTLGETSEIAARAALAARVQGAYGVLQSVFLGLEPQVPADERPAVTLAQVLGLDVERLYRDMGSAEVEDHLATSRHLAEALNLTAAPAFVIGDVMLAGAVTADDLADAVAVARATAAR